MINFCDIDIKRLDKYLWNYKKGLSLQPAKGLRVHNNIDSKWFRNKIKKTFKKACYKEKNLYFCTRLER